MPAMAGTTRRYLHPFTLRIDDLMLGRGTGSHMTNEEYITPIQIPTLLSPTGLGQQGVNQLEGLGQQGV